MANNVSLMLFMGRKRSTRICDPHASFRILNLRPSAASHACLWTLAYKVTNVEFRQCWQQLSCLGPPLLGTSGTMIKWPCLHFIGLYLNPRKSSYFYKNKITIPNDMTRLGSFKDAFTVHGLWLFIGQRKRLRFFAERETGKWKKPRLVQGL